MGTRCADHVTPLYPQKLALTSLTGGGRSVGIVRVRTKAMEFSLEGFVLEPINVMSVCDFTEHSTETPANHAWLHDYKRGQIEETHTLTMSQCYRAENTESFFFTLDIIYVLDLTLRI